MQWIESLRTKTDLRSAEGTVAHHTDVSFEMNELIFIKLSYQLGVLFWHKFISVAYLRIIV